MAGKQRWWTALFGRKDTTTTIEESTESVDAVGGPPVPDATRDIAPAAGAFTFLAPEPEAAPPGEPSALFDTQPNPALTTGRLRALGLAPVHVPSLAEQLLLYRVVAQEHAQENPAAALARWQAILALCPADVEARIGRATAQTALGALDDAEAAWRAVLELCPDHPDAIAAVNPTELRHAIDPRVAGGDDA